MECLHELGGACLVEPRQRRLLEISRDHTIDSAAVPTAGQVEVLLDQRRQTKRMLNHFPVDVRDIQSAVGGIGKLGRPKPDVA